MSTWILHSINADENRRRFYYISTQQPTLYDEVAVTRIYGQLGVWSKVMVPQAFETQEDALRFVAKTIQTRLKHGYTLVGGEPIAVVEKRIRGTSRGTESPMSGRNYYEFCAIPG